VHCELFGCSAGLGDLFDLAAYLGDGFYVVEMGGVGQPVFVDVEQIQAAHK
jgi:hypothetical protein